jgi:hypothetical protein
VHARINEQRIAALEAHMPSLAADAEARHAAAAAAPRMRACEV